MKLQVFLLLILTAALWGTTPILDKIGVTRVSPLTAITIRSAAVMLVLGIYLVVTGSVRAAFTVDLKSALILGASGVIAGLLAMVTYFWALRAGATSKVVPIAATYPLMTALLSIIILREPVTPLRLAGTALIVVGVWLVQR